MSAPAARTSRLLVQSLKRSKPSLTQHTSRRYASSEGGSIGGSSSSSVLPGAAAAVLVAAPLAYYLLRPLPYEDDNVTFVPNSPSDSRKRDTPQQTSQAGGSPPVKRGKKHDNPYAQELGAGPEESQTATSREGTRGTQSGDIAGKQFGISTGRTRHSMPIDQGDDKSKKSTGEPETAKAQGTVPVRPPH